MSRNKIYVFNPLNEDFSVKYDVNNDKNPVSFTIIAKETAKFDKHVVKHLKKHLADRMFDVKGDYRKAREPQIKKFYKEMEIK